MNDPTLPKAELTRLKRNTTELLDLGSYHIGRRQALKGSTLEADMGLPTRDHAAHGSAVALRVGGVRLGMATVSGLPQRADHNLLVGLRAPLAGVAHSDIALT